MFAAMKRMDLVIEGTNGGPCVVQIDHRDADEVAAARELSTVFAVHRMLEPRRVGRPTPEVRYFIRTMPPAFLVEAVAAAGGRMFVGEDPRVWKDVTDSAGGRNPRPTEAIVNEAMSALARRTLKEAGLPVDASGLAQFERSLLDVEIELDVDVEGDEGEEDEEEAEGPDAADGGESWWTKIVKLAACGGEVLGQQVDGRWVVSMDHERTFALMYECKAGNKEIAANLLGKAEKLMTAGIEDSVTTLVGVVATMLKSP